MPDACAVSERQSVTVHTLADADEKSAVGLIKEIILCFCPRDQAVEPRVHAASVVDVKAFLSLDLDPPLHHPLLHLVEILLKLCLIDSLLLAACAFVETSFRDAVVAEVVAVGTCE